jgi:hypothetical protein
VGSAYVDSWIPVGNDVPLVVRFFTRAVLFVSDWILELLAHIAIRTQLAAHVPLLLQTYQLHTPYHKQTTIYLVPHHTLLILRRPRIPLLLIAVFALATPDPGKVYVDGGVCALGRGVLSGELPEHDELLACRVRDGGESSGAEIDAEVFLFPMSVM